MEYATTEELKEKLRRRLNHRTQLELAKEIGISPQMLSMLLSPRYPVTGKAVKWLGYKKVRSVLFERIK